MREQHINWYPLHMHRAQQQMRESLSKVDLIIELRDARLPKLTAAPYNYGKSVPRIVVLNKTDLISTEDTQRWEKQLGYPCMGISCTSKKVLKRLSQRIKNHLDSLHKNRQSSVYRSFKWRIMLLGAPNVGKSTLINAFKGKRVLKTAPVPGVTKNSVWIATDAGFQIMDTPGVLLPRIGNLNDAYRLIWINSIPDRPEYVPQAAGALLEFLKQHELEAFLRLLPPSVTADAHPEDILRQLALDKGMLGKQAQPDVQRLTHKLLQNFRLGKLGQICLEKPH